jgi:hypothetical protein
MRILIVLLVLSTVGYFLHKRHEKYEELEALRTEAKTVDGLITERQKWIVDLKSKVEPLRQGEEELKKPDGSPEQLEKDVLALREALTTGAGKLDTAEDDYLAAVNDMREEAKKQTFPTLKLPNGEELKDCKIARFGEGFIQVAHAEGSAKLSSEDLPEGWADRYAVDYVSRHSKAENEAMSAKVQEAVLTPLDLKKAKLSEIDERIKAVNEQLLAFSGNIRESRRQADKMVRDAYRISMGDGPRGASAANQRDAMFKKAKELEAAREGTRLKYVALRKQKEDLERQRLLIKKAPLNQPPAPPPP